MMKTQICSLNIWLSGTKEGWAILTFPSKNIPKFIINVTSLIDCLMCAKNYIRANKTESSALKLEREKDRQIGEHNKFE